jgi:EpsI family protein
MALLFCYAAVLVSLVDKWSNHPLYSYGFAVPLISAYMVWTRADRLRTVPLIPDYTLGVPLMLIGLGMFVIGYLGALTTLQQLSLMFSLTGLLLLCLGRQLCRAIWFPLAYLLLMFPIWDQPISRLQIPSQVMSARIAIEIIHWLGIPAVRDATMIVLPNVTLEVLRECSGVNQLIVVFAMVLPAAYLFLSGAGRRTVLVSVAVVVAYLSNGFRIALVGFMAQHGLKEAADAHGPLHLIQGLVVSGVGYCVIGVCLSLLSKPRRVDPHATAARGPAEFATLRRPWLEGAMLLVILMTGTYRLVFRPVDVSLDNSLHTLPSQLEDWTIETYQPASDIRFAAVDEEVMRSYRNRAGERLRLYVGYYRYQESGKELNGDTSRALDQDAAGFTLELPNESVVLKQIERGSEGGGLFWYDVNGRVVNNIYLVKAYTIWDAMTRRRTNGAVIVVMWDGSQSHAAREKAVRFVRAVMPFLRQSLPS